jgi:D-tyrosyl-tRNA(Tyr) deacylase
LAQTVEGTQGELARRHAAAVNVVKLVGVFTLLLMLVALSGVLSGAVRFNPVAANTLRFVVVFLGVGASDAAADVDFLARRIANLRIFEDDAGRFDRSLLDVGGEALVVSQFTLIADTWKGNRPSFTAAAAPEDAEALYEQFCDALAALGVPIARGVFGARMAVGLINDGPVTIVL